MKLLMCIGSGLISATLLTGCGASTPEEVVRAWAKAQRSGDIEDVMEYSYQDQFQPRVDLKNEAQVEEFERSAKKTREIRDYWGYIKSGKLVREYILDDHAWVTLKFDKIDVETWELVRYKDEWKVLDRWYDGLAVINGTK